MPKFFARRDFANNLQPPLEIEGALHERHVHEGAVIVIGPPETEFKDLPERSPLRPIIAQLYAAECLIEAGDDKAVARLKKELAADETRKRTDKELEAGAKALAGKK